MTPQIGELPNDAPDDCEDGGDEDRRLRVGLAVVVWRRHVCGRRDGRERGRESSEAYVYSNFLSNCWLMFGKL